MSHDVCMKKDGKVLPTNHPAKGGRYAVAVLNPDTEALLEPLGICDLNVTYNYSWFYYKFLDTIDGLEYLYGKKGSECLPRLEYCLAQLCSKGMGNGKFSYDKDYWAPTAGNAAVPIKTFIEWCKEHPDGIFEGD